MRILLLALLALLAAAPACALGATHLTPFPDPGPGAALATVGCLEVLIEPIADPEAEGPAARIAFGNTCDGPVPVHLHAIVATARYRDGSTGALRVHDPHGVIRPGVLDGRMRGAEVLEFHPVDAVVELQPMDAEPDRVPERLCLELGALDGRAGRPVSACVRVPTRAAVETAHEEDV